MPRQAHDKREEIRNETTPVSFRAVSFRLGDWKDGLYHGQGSKLYSKGGGYIGQWYDGRRSGEKQKNTDHFVLNSPSLKIEDLPRQARDKHTRERDPRSKSKRPFGVPGEGVSVYGGKFGYDRWVGTFENDLPHGVGLMYMAAATDGDGEGGGCDSEDSRPFEFIRGEPVEER